MEISWDEMGNYPVTHPLYGPEYVILSATKPCFWGCFYQQLGRRDHFMFFDFSPKLIGAVCGCLTACNAQTKNLGHNNLQLAHSTVPGRTLTNRLISNHGIEDLIEQSSLLIIFFWKKKSTPTELTRSNLSPTRYPQHH